MRHAFALVVCFLARLAPGLASPQDSIGLSITESYRVIFPLPQSSQARTFVEFLKMRMEAGEFRAVIDRAYPLETIAEAYRYVVTEQKTGIVVITVRIA
jgi:NADPH:quinone reductase-like Zn-dependent oxidoreductase